MSWDILVEIELDADTLKYSINGVSPSGGFYDGVVDSIGDVVREVTPAGGVSPIQSCYVTLKDAEGTIRTNAKNNQFLRRILRIKLINLETGEQSTFFSGRIEDREVSYDSFRLDVRDESFDLLSEKIALRTTAELFPDMPKETRIELIPIVLGTVDSSDFGNEGHIPAYLVDPAENQVKYRYVAAQHPLKDITKVFRNGVEISVSDYDVEYANVVTDLGTVKMTFIDFSVDQRDGGEAVDITYDAQGLTDDNTETGDLITNPATALKHFLELQSVLFDADFDAALMTSVEAAYDAESISVGYAVTRESTWLDVIRTFSESFNLQFFKTKDSLFGMVFDDASTPADTSGLTSFSDQENILQGSFNHDRRPVNRAAATLDFFYARDFARDEWDQQHNFNDSDEETSLGRNVTDSVELFGIRGINQGQKISEIKLFQRRSARVFPRFSIEPDSDLELGDYTKLTHFAGESEDNLGFRDMVSRIRSISLRLDQGSPVFEVGVIDAPGLSVTEPSPPGSEPSRNTGIPNPRFIEVVSNVVWFPASQTQVNWNSTGETGSFSVKIVFPSGSKTYTVNSGTTGAMAAEATTYVYFAPDVSETAFQTTTTFSDAIAPRRFLAAICQRAPTADQLAIIDNKIGLVRVNSKDVTGQTGGAEMRDGTISARHVVVGTLTANLLAATLTYTGTLILKDNGNEKAGMTAASDAIPDDAIRIWAGDTYANRYTAKFRVTQGGALTSTSGEIAGWTIAATSLAKNNATLHSSGYLVLGTGNEIIRLDAADADYRLWIGHSSAASAPFSVTKAGVATMIGGVFQSAVSGRRIEIDSYGVYIYKVIGGVDTISSFYGHSTLTNDARILADGAFQFAFYDDDIYNDPDTGLSTYRPRFRVGLDGSSNPFAFFETDNFYIRDKSATERFSITSTGVVASMNFLPSAGTLDLGSSTALWDELHVNKIVVNSDSPYLKFTNSNPWVEHTGTNTLHLVGFGLKNTGTGGVEGRVIVGNNSSTPSNVMWVGAVSNHALILATNATTRIRIDNDGKTGFFGATPVAKPSAGDLPEVLTALHNLGLITNTS